MATAVKEIRNFAYCNSIPNCRTTKGRQLIILTVKCYSDNKTIGLEMNDTRLMMTSVVET
jgi:hypothetical protein